MPVSEPSIAERVRLSIGDLTAAEKRVARTLLSNYPIAGLESMTALADRAGVSAPTILRFVAKLGYDGYGDFQRELRDEVQARITSPLTLYEQSPPAHDDALLRTAEETFTTNLTQTFRSLPEAEFTAAVRLLADARRTVHCVGGRFSGILARYLYAHLYHIRGRTTLIDPGIRPIADAVVDIGKDHVVVVFDYRRYQPDIVALARAAAARHATVVVFTDPWLSPASDVAQIVLPSRVEAPSPYDSLVTGLALVETVVAGLVAQIGGRARRRVESLEATRAELQIALQATSDDGQRP